MYKKTLAAAIFAAITLILTALVSANSSATERITPNKLIIDWNDNRFKRTEINIFRIRGYNVAQLRALVGACGGNILKLEDNTYQIVKTSEVLTNFDAIGFTGAQDVKVQINVTQIRDISGALITPGQPGWVYLPDHQYNWGSLRDILAAMSLEIISFSDDPVLAETRVVLGDKAAGSANTLKGLYTRAELDKMLKIIYDLEAVNSRADALGTSIYASSPDITTPFYPGVLKE
ncbi:MAG: hypothetical protein LBQ68_04105, partial [Clostridiales bacterium]|nr:hypothetical protein [Clostridiales bacterium]